MATTTELERLAQMATVLRPDWPLRSILTYLSNEHSARAYRDLASALAWVAADSETKTPRRMSGSGPWWNVTAGGSDLRAERCPIDGHTSYLKANCGACRYADVEEIADPPHQHDRTPAVSADRVREIRSAAIPTTRTTERATR